MTVLVGLCFSPPASANSISSVVVARDGTIYFSDYIRDRIWRVDAQGRLSFFLEGKHTHHLLLDAQGNLYGEHRPRSAPGHIASLWRATPEGHVTDLSVPGYEGEVFLRGEEGSIYFPQQCQLVRVTPEGRRVALAGTDCEGQDWHDAALRFAHLHGSLAWLPDGSILFSDAKRVRRVTLNGGVFDLSGVPAQLFETSPGRAVPRDIGGVAVDSKGEVYVIEPHFGGCIERLTQSVDQPIAQYVSCARLFWTRDGLGFAEGAFYVVEERGPLPKILSDVVGSPRVLRVAPDGTQQVLAVVKSTPTRILTALAFLLCLVGLVLVWLHRRARSPRATHNLPGA